MAGVELRGWEELARSLDRIDSTLRGRVIGDAVKAAAEIVATRARELSPVGDTSDKPDLKPLRDTIEIRVRDYGQRALAVTGPGLPAGAHGHNVEHGHAIVRNGKTVGRARPKPFLRPAFDETKGAQQAAMEGVIARTIRELNG